MADKVGMAVQPSNHWYQKPAVIASIVTFVALGAILGAGAVYGYLQGVGTINFAFLCSGSGVSVLMAFLSPVFTLCQKKKTPDDKEQPPAPTDEKLQRSAAALTQDGTIPTIQIEVSQENEQNVEGRDRSYSDFPPEAMRLPNRGQTGQSPFPFRVGRTSQLDRPDGWRGISYGDGHQRTLSDVSAVSVVVRGGGKKK